MSHKESRTMLPAAVPLCLRALGALFAALLLSACGGSSGSSEQSAASFVAAGVSVSGQLTIENNAEQDADIQQNGVISIATANNDLTSAQRLNNPTSLGGYLSATAGNYSNGQIYARDERDVYSIPMLDGQSLFVTVREADSNLDMPFSVLVTVYRASNTLVPVYSNRTFKPLKMEFVANSDDEYIVDILSNLSGTSPILYQLSTSTTLASGQTLARGTYAELASDRVMYQSTQGELIELDAQSKSDLAKLQSLRTATYLTDMLGGRAEPDYLVRSSSVSVNDPFRSLQWNLDMIRVPDAWSAATGSGVRVAVIDTGASPSHQDLQGNIRYDQGFDFISFTDNGDGDGRDFDPSETEFGTFHGAHISGVIAADTNNSRGIAGIAFDAEVIPIRALDEEGTGSVFDIADAIRYASGLLTSDGRQLAQKADIINLSLGLDEDSFVLRGAIRDAADAGVILVAAAGNDSTNALFYPAAYAEVFGVGSVNHEGFISLFSNYGSNVSLMAPGGTDTGSLYFDGEEDDFILGPTAASDAYGLFLGTSFAAPHFSAVIALMKEIDPSIDSARLASLLDDGMLTDARSSTEQYGRGVLNAQKAVSAVGGALADSLEAFPSSLSFSEDEDRLTVTLDNFGIGTVLVNGLDFSVPWLSETGTDVDGFGLGRYAISVDPNLVPDGAQAEEISVRYTINGGAEQVLSVPVFITGSATTSELSGVYVYLVPRDEAQNSGQIEIVQSRFFDLVTGSVSFTFNNVPEGEYYLEASTDIDGDRRLFDAGEAIGAYRLSNAASFLNLVDDVSGLSFSMGFNDLNETLEFADPNDAQRDRLLP